ncbi:MAG: acetyl-CoA carboxylase carboxyltransferase subunit alpha [Bdellovibrionota bacterium]|jgi:acetyl-CoA carboxylase carboxyl transferase subunit alpha
MINHPLEFEKPLVELEIELQKLKDEIAAGDLNKQSEYARLEKRVAKMMTEVYGRLTPYQKVQLSRHLDRPFSLDYIKLIFTDFMEFHGDRLFRDDPAIVGGTAKLQGQPIMIVGHQRGRTTAERLHRNFGMPQPEGYRKALRLFEMAAKFGLPLITFIDTAGAFPGIEAEERGQAEAIARNLRVLSELPTPVLAVVIGEGGSGGALALGVADKVLMMENSCYSVISPEGCASILWKVPEEEAAQYVPVAAEALKITAKDLKQAGIIDVIVPEPLGGAHRNHKEAAESLEAALVRELKEVEALPLSEMLDLRYKKFRSIGVFTGDRA